MGRYAGGEGDLCTGPYDPLGELKSWVNVALRRKCYKEEVWRPHGCEICGVYHKRMEFVSGSEVKRRLGLAGR